MPDTKRPQDADQQRQGQQQQKSPNRDPQNPSREGYENEKDTKR